MPDTEASDLKERDQIIHTAAKDVRLLISYLSRRPPKDTVDWNLDGTLADKLLTSQYMPEEEAALWKQLAELSALAHPASAASIRDSKYYKAVFGRE